MNAAQRRIVDWFIYRTEQNINHGVRVDNLPTEQMADLAKAIQLLALNVDNLAGALRVCLETMEWEAVAQSVLRDGDKSPLHDANTAGSDHAKARDLANKTLRFLVKSQRPS